MTIELRDYQQDAIDGLFSFFEKKEGVPLIVAPTGAGKSILVAEIIRLIYLDNPNLKIMVLQPRANLIQQNFSKLLKLAPEISMGIFCASLGLRQANKRCVFGMINSVYMNSHLFGHVDVIIIDEAHEIPAEGDGMYRTFIANIKARNPNVAILGLTATPFRLKSGMLMDGDDPLFTDICYNIEISRLIKDGYLSDVVSKSGISTPDMTGLHVRAGDFIQKELDELYTESLSKEIVAEIMNFTRDRKKVLVFASGVKHAEEVRRVLQGHKISSEVVTGDTLFREEILTNFKKGKFKFLINVNVLTTGYDEPEIDCIVMLRPTKSTGLYVQMIGRGMRTAPGKMDCLVLDFAGNIERHGPVDKIAIRKKTRKNKDGETEIVETLVKESATKTCPKCRSILSANSKVCSLCSYLFPVILNQEASNQAILSDQFSSFDIGEVKFANHFSHRSGKNMLKVEYFNKSSFKVATEYILLEHSGFAKQKAISRWKLQAKNPDIIPETVDEALFYIDTGELKDVAKIKVKKEGDFDKVVAFSWKEKNESRDNVRLDLERTSSDF